MGFFFRFQHVNIEVDILILTFFFPLYDIPVLTSIVETGLSSSNTVSHLTFELIRFSCYILGH